LRHSGLALLAALSLAVPAAVPASSPPLTPPQPPREAEAIPVALLYDIGSGQTLLDRRADLRFVPASMTKVMTAYVAFELIRQGRLRPDQSFRVAPGTSARFAASGATMNLRDGEAVSADMLIRGITTISANDAALVLAEGIAGDVGKWCGMMNAEASRLGMTDSHFATPNGWPDGGKTFVSARDLARLGEALIYRHPALYRRYFGQKTFTWPRAEGENHDPIVGVVPGADGIKTGHTREAGFNFLGSAERGGQRLLMVVAGGRSEQERAAASRALLEWGFAEWQVLPLFAAGNNVAEARVQGGDKRRVALSAPFDVHALLPRRSTPDLHAIRLRLTYQGPLVAPIAKGQKVAELEIAAPGQPAGHVPLYAAESVALAGPLDRLVNGLAGLLP
jgi:D-alanyl-D-alanine carboxypeptidase (penicillin-binding protein 5/6)